MEDKGSSKVLDLYIKANENKNEIVFETEDGQKYSRAEMVALACMVLLIRSLENKELDFDFDKVIKTVILSSLDGKIDNLRKKDEYNRLIKASKELETEEGYGAKIVYERMLSDFKFYLNPVYNEEKFVNRNLKLHDTERIGHVYWGAKTDRLENVLEHIYGCLVLSLGIESEYGYDVDFNKIRRMLIFHETGEIIEKDKTVWDMSKEEREERERNAIIKILSDLPNKEELLELWEEFDSKQTLLAEYAYLIDKIEYDMQVKMYDKAGKYDFNNVPQNVATNSEDVKQIIANGAQSVFEVHYEYDKNKYNRIPCFRRILEETKKY